MATTQFSLVLLGRFAGKDRAVAAALARDFGHDDAWGSQVLGAAPIVLLDGLSAEQAQAVHSALADVETAGSRIEVQPGVDAGLPKLSWPQPPRIKGRLVAEFIAPAAQGVTANIFLPCPYTGQRMKLTLTISLAKAGDLAVTGVAAATAPIPIPVPMAPVPIPHPSSTGARASVPVDAYKPIPTPVFTPVVPAAARPRPPGAPSGPSPAVRSLTPGAGTPPAPPPPPIIGLDELDELQPMEQIPAPAAPAPAAVSPRPPSRIMVPVPPRPSTAPAPPQARPPLSRQTGSVALRSAPAPMLAPLPDVPILQNQPPPPAPGVLPNPGQAPLPADLMGAPMDLSAFEANLTASGILQATPSQRAPGSGGAPAQPPAPAEPPDNAPADDGALWSVFMGRSANAKVHQLVAEVQGMSVADAAKLCQKPVVALAKDVSGADAKALKQRFAAVNVAVRMTRRS